MSRKIIRCSLNHSSLRSAIQQLEAYQKDIQRKNQIFVDKLAQEGIQVIQTTMESIPSEEKGSYYTEVINMAISLVQQFDFPGTRFFLSSLAPVFLTERTVIHYRPVLIMVLVLTQTKNMLTTQTDGGMWMKVDESIILMVTGRICRCTMQKKLSLFKYATLQKKCSEIEYPILKYGII